MNDRVALLVVDVQQGFDHPDWPPRNNHACEDNVAALIEAWRANGQPIVYVRHDSDLATWLRSEGIERVAVCGVQTNMCCETTARVAANLDFDMTFVLDATHTFDLPAHDGGTITADELARVTASNLDPEFGRVVTTREALASLG